jgi:peroxiredoxin
MPINQIFFTVAVLLFTSLAQTDQQEHEYAPIMETRLVFNDFTYKGLDGRELNLRDYASGKQVIIVNFSAAWCKNSNLNGPVLQRLYEKYKDRGLGVVGVMEYSDPEEIRIHINRIGITYPVVVETYSREDRDKTQHFKYRTAVADKRKWGTPFYALIDARSIEPPRAGAPLTTRLHVIAGEMIESEIEGFIQAHFE